jgi:hypothetical protein
MKYITMKKSICIIILSLCCSFVFAHNYTSVLGGGHWTVAATWTGGPAGTVPGANDTANIASAVLLDANHAVRRVVINVGQTLTIQWALYVYGTMVINGTFAIGSAGCNVVFYGSNMTVVTGKGPINVGAWGTDFEFGGVNAVIDSTIEWINYGTIYLLTNTAPVSVINKGHIILGSGNYLLNYSASHSCTWTNAKNSYLYLTYNGSYTDLGNSFDTLYASAPGDTVFFWGANVSCTIKKPVGNKFYDLYLGSSGSSGIVNIPSNLMVNLLDVYSSGKVNLNGYNVSISSNWADYGTITNNTGTVTFDAKGSQCVLRTSGTEAFKNMTITRTSKLGSNCTVSASGTVYLQPGGSMDCTCP